MNWEALEVIGGGAIALFVVIAPIAVWWHRRGSDPSRPTEASLTATGAIVLSGMVLAMLIGAIFKDALLANVPAWARTIVALAYVLAVTLVAALIGTFLERHGYPFSRPASGASPPNNRIERTREQ